MQPLPKRAINLPMGLILAGLSFVFTISTTAEARRLGVAAPAGDALAAELVRALQVQTQDVIMLTTDDRGDEVARQQAPAQGCDLLLFARSSVTGYRLDAELIETIEGRRLARESVTGAAEQVFDLVDQLGDRVSRTIRTVHLPQNTVVVLPFINEAGAADAPLVSGLPQMLLTSLHQDPQLTLVESTGLPAEQLSASANPAEAGRWLGADVVVRGTFTQQVQITVELTAVAQNRSLGVFERRTSRQELPQTADALADEILAAAVQHRGLRQTVAVLPFQNHGEAQYDAFVNGLADMLTTSIGQTARLTVIERVQIETAMRNFNLEMSGAIDPETAVEVGAWLGADAVVMGSFLRFGKVYRIDARMIDAETGEVLAADSESGPEDAVMGLVDALGSELVTRFDERVPAEATGTGELEVLFRMTKAEMGERPVYFHLCKLYVDGKYMDTGSLVKKVDRWNTLFSRTLRSGPHRVQVVHGFANGREWDGRMPLQPDTFDIYIEPEATATVRYTYEVGWFKDQYLYDSTWERAAPGRSAAD